MRPDEHYRKAEQLLTATGEKLAATTPDRVEADLVAAGLTIGSALVHAVLALAKPSDCTCEPVRGGLQLDAECPSHGGIPG